MPERPTKKPTMRKWLRLAPAGLTLALLCAMPAAASEQVAPEAEKEAFKEAAKEQAPARPKVVYDGTTDFLSVTVHEVSLRVLLAKIAILSGIEIEMDSAVEQPVSISMEDRRLEDGLKQIALVLGLNHAMIFQKEAGAEESAEAMLIYMKIVRKAGGGNPNLISVVALEHEAIARSKHPPRDRGEEPPAPAMFDYARQRWQARMENMPEEERERLEEKAEEFLERLEKRKQRKEEQTAAHEKRRAEHKARQQADDEELKATNPERYELRMQRREELRQKVAEEIVQEESPE